MHNNGGWRHYDSCPVSVPCNLKPLGLDTSTILDWHPPSSRAGSNQWQLVGWDPLSTLEASWTSRKYLRWKRKKGRVGGDKPIKLRLLSLVLIFLGAEGWSIQHGPPVRGNLVGCSDGLWNRINSLIHATYLPLSPCTTPLTPFAHTAEMSLHQPESSPSWFCPLPQSVAVEKHDTNPSQPKSAPTITISLWLGCGWIPAWGQPSLPVPTIDAKGILNLQARAGLLTEHRRHAQHILKGEQAIVGENLADTVSERVDLWMKRGGVRKEKIHQCQVPASFFLKL